MTALCRRCRKPLTMAARDGLCDSPACHQPEPAGLFRPRCTICGGPVPADARLATVCNDPDCRREDLRHQGRQAIVRQREAVRMRARELRAAAGLEAPERYTLAIIPSYLNEVTPLSDERRVKFLLHLRKLAGQALGETEGSPGGVIGSDEPEPYAPIPPAIGAVLGQACGVCQGYCCRTGAEHAHLRVYTLRRYFDANPTHTPEDAVAEFGKYIGTETYNGSCVYHSRAGCTLRHDLRSQVCHNFLCVGLLDYIAELPEGEPPRAFVASTSGQFVVDTRVVEG